MQQQSLAVCNVCCDRSELQRIHELDGLLSSALYAEAHNTACAVRAVLLRKLVLGIRLKAGILNPSDPVIRCQELGNLQRIGAVTCHTYRQRLKTNLDIVSVLGRLDGTEVSHELCCCLCDVCALAELCGICDAVVRLVRCAEAGELLCMSHPVEVA